MKKITLSLLTLFILITSNLNLFAEEEKLTFLDVVKQNENYKEYFDQISGLEVNKEVETDEGVRKTISFILAADSEDVSRKLIFIGNEEDEIIYELILIQTDSNYSLIDLNEGRTNSINFTANSGARGAVYQCSKYTCNKWKTTYSLSVESGCPFYIGEPCNTLSLLGTEVFVYLCKAGVFIACHISRGRGCTNYYEELSICSI